MSGFAQPRVIVPAAKNSAETAVRRRSAVGAMTPSYVFMLLFVFLLYSQLPTLYPELDALRLSYTLGGLAIVSLIIERASVGRGLDFVWPDSYLMLGFIVAAGLSCLTALWLGAAVENVETLLKIGALYLLIVNCVKNESQLRKLIWLLVLCGLFPAIGTLSHYLQRSDLVDGTRGGWVGIFSNPNELAYSLVILAPLAAALTHRARAWQVVLLWVIVATYILATYVTFSRGGMLGLLAVLTLLGFRSRNVLLSALLVILLGVSVIFMLYGWSRTEGFTNLHEDTNVQSRLATIEGGVAMWMDHPITGVGLGCSMYAWPLYAPADIHDKWLIIHNTFVEALAETGIGGFVLFCFMIGVALWGARKMSRRSAATALDDSSHLAMGLELALWGFLVCGLSGGFVLTWFPYMLAALVAALKKIRGGLPVPMSAH